MCNFRHPGPRRVWDGGPSHGSCHHLVPSRGSRHEFQKRRSCCYTRHFRAREVRGPFRAMRRLRSCLGSRRSRARESTAKSTFIRKTQMTFFCVFAGRSQTPYFYNELSPSRSFTIFTRNWANSTSGPRGASGIQCGQNLTQSGSNLIPIG